MIFSLKLLFIIKHIFTAGSGESTFVLSEFLNEDTLERLFSIVNFKDEFIRKIFEKHTAFYFKSSYHYNINSSKTSEISFYNSLFEKTNDNTVDSFRKFFDDHEDDLFVKNTDEKDLLNIQKIIENKTIFLLKLFDNFDIKACDKENYEPFTFEYYDNNNKKSIYHIKKLLMDLKSFFASSYLEKLSLEQGKHAVLISKICINLFFKIAKLIENLLINFVLKIHNNDLFYIKLEKIIELHKYSFDEILCLMKEIDDEKNINAFYFDNIFSLFSRIKIIKSTGEHISELIKKDDSKKLKSFLDNNELFNGIKEDEFYKKLIEENFYKLCNLYLQETDANVFIDWLEKFIDKIMLNIKRDSEYFFEHKANILKEYQNIISEVNEKISKMEFSDFQNFKHFLENDLINKMILDYKILIKHELRYMYYDRDFILLHDISGILLKSVKKRDGKSDKNEDIKLEKPLNIIFRLLRTVQPEDYFKIHFSYLSEDKEIVDAIDYVKKHDKKTLFNLNFNFIRKWLEYRFFELNFIPSNN